MLAAHGDNCDDFPPPEHPAEFHPFFGKYAATGKPTTTYPSEQDGETTTPSTGGASPDQKFDPRYYEQAPQNAPNIQVPPATPPQDNQQGQQGGNAPGAQ